MIEVSFLFDYKLTAEVEKLIKESKYKLLLISPFIDLDKRIQDALSEKINNHDFELLVLFGKNKDNCFKSIKKDSIDFLKKFPNIEIRYNERLHAKFYQNDFNYIMTSMNLYGYSLSKNIEVGILCKYAEPGLVGKVVNSSSTIISQGYDKVSHDVFGYEKEVNPMEKFLQIFKDSELKFKTSPVIVEKSGLRGIVGGKKLEGCKVIVDKLNYSVDEPMSQKHENNLSVISKVGFVSNETTIKESHSNLIGKTMSASQLSKIIGVTPNEITNLMESVGLISGNRITESGQSKGLVLKSYMGNDYIAYPENLSELKSLKNN